MVSEAKKIVEVQLNRSLRSNVEVVSRCHFDLPAVIKVPSNLDDGTPFPTSYWLTCPMYNKKVGSLESHGLIKELDKQLNENEDLRKLWSDRQRSYEEERNKRRKNKKEEITPKGGVGGATESIKCLHAHLADELATNKNYIGKIVLESVGGFNCEEPCIDENYKKNVKWKSKW
tara:strand:+ start:4933 stop:5454 length:522 start_codon:yes stop_codon:yes gene_type:complete